MKGAVKVFLDAVKETPRLYFMPLAAALSAVGRVEKEMQLSGTERPLARAKASDGLVVTHPKLTPRGVRRAKTGATLAAKKRGAKKR